MELAEGCFLVEVSIGMVPVLLREAAVLGALVSAGNSSKSRAAAEELLGE